MNITPAQRAAFAEKAGVHEQYLYQCLTGRKAMKPEEAVRVEQVTDRAVMRWDLRTNDWHRIWPELIATDGAPPVPLTSEVA